jgi:hypothetical protein
MEWPLSSDNLLGLKRLKRYDVAPGLALLDIAPRTMPESLRLVNWSELAGEDGAA